MPTDPLFISQKQIRDLTEEEVNEFFKGSQRNRVPSLIKNDEQHK